MFRDERKGWSWGAFFLGPIWYLKEGMIGKGVFLLLLAIGSVFLAVPFLMAYSGVRAKKDLYNFRLAKKSRINLDKL